ncbi:MAG TPA: alpha/beta hydrolase [Mycobacteriales bacterium]|jgi:pimeloyl-ACP methyl ester carboxylesterase|nr:alpha/beta hydrolase [Mycobacteriales bacterium]
MTMVSTVAGAGLRRVIRVPSVASVPEGRYVELPGRGRTYVTDIPGPAPDAPVVVLLHALTTTATLSWYPVMADLAQHYRVVTFDQRWHGRGIRSHHFRLADCADDVAAVLDALGIEKVLPVGYSMGGAIAQLFWKQHPHRVSGLVLCSTSRNFRCARRERLFFPLLSAAMLPLSPYARSRVERYAATVPELPSFDCTDNSWGRLEFRSTSAWSMPAVLAELGRFNSAPWVADIDVPTSVVVTEKDRAIPARRQLRLAECIPGAQVHTLDGGHVSLVLGADRFRTVLLEALGSVVARSHVTRVPRARGAQG